MDRRSGQDEHHLFVLLNRKGLPVGAYGNAGFAFTDTPMIGEAMYVDAADRPVITGLNAGLPRVVRLQP